MDQGLRGHCPDGLACRGSENRIRSGDHFPGVVGMFNVFSEQEFRFMTFVTSHCGRNSWIASKRQQLLFAVKAISQTPEFRTAGLDLEEKPSAL